MQLPVCLDWQLACESNSSSQHCLQQLDPDRCLFVDVLDISAVAKSEYHSHMNEAQDIDFALIWKRLQRSPWNGFGRCKTHGRECQRIRQVVLDVSGSPCVSWSSAGRQKQDRNPVMVIFMAWCLWVRHAKPLLVLHENVTRFKEWVLKHCLCLIRNTKCQFVMQARQPHHVSFFEGADYSCCVFTPHHMD